MAEQVDPRQVYRYADYPPYDPVATRRQTLLKLGLGCVGLSMILFAGVTLAILIITPIWFRSLPTSEQVVWMNRIPMLEAFKPTRVYAVDVLPTAQVDLEAAKTALLNLQTPIPTASSTPLPGPTSLLVTNTPVLGPLAATPTRLPPTAIALLPTASPTPTLPPTPLPTQIPAPVAYQGQGFRFIKQTWNTCGPANLTQALLYLGWQGTKEQVIDYLKPNVEDRNVSPWEMVNYVNDYLNAQRNVPIRALMRVGGDMNLIKRLVANNFGVILEKGYFVAGEGWMGHYLTVQGYDDTRREMHGLDTYLGDRWEAYDTLDERWQQFNRLFIVLYPQDRERELATVLGPYQDPTYGVRAALAKAQEEANLRPENPFAWFNIGSAYTLLGDYKNAARAFDLARSVGEQLPFRMLWYQFTMYEAYYNVGQYGEVEALAQATLGTSSDLEESHYWRGMALAAQGNTDGAIRAFQRALTINPKFTPARDRLAEVRNGTFRKPV